MYARLFKPSDKDSYFLFGPRGTGKTSWLNAHYKKALYIDLLQTDLFNDLRARPNRIWDIIPNHYKGTVIIDEVQKLPSLLDEIHASMNKDRERLQFILTGSSVRKLRKASVNMLAGRIRVRRFYPFLAQELGDDFKLQHAVKFGMLPEAWTATDPDQYLESYLKVYIDQEIRLEGLARNIEDFARFLEGASLAQGAPLNISNVSSDSGVPRKTVEGYFQVLDDLLLGYRIPIFQRKAKRELIKHSKFYFFDVGLYQVLRPRGVLDSDSEIAGAAVETLVLQHLIAINDLKKMKYEISYLRTKNHIEVDFVLYGPRGLIGIEVKASAHVSQRDLRGLKLFLQDYPKSKSYIVYGGSQRKKIDNIEMIPITEFCLNIEAYI